MATAGGAGCQGLPLTAAEQATLDNLEITDIARDLALRDACKVAGDACDSARRGLNAALNSYASGAAAMTDARLSATGNAAVVAERDQDIALGNDPGIAAQSLLDSFKEFAAPQLAGYAVGAALGAYVNEAKAIYAAIKAESTIAVPVTSGGAANTATGVKLAKTLSSEEQLNTVLAGNGIPIAGSGSKIPLRDSPRLVSEYGGNASDWSKVSSGSYIAADGTVTEIHAYQNSIIGKVVEPKTIVIRSAN